MTALRSFQAEIEQFSQERQRQQIRESRDAQAAAEAAKHHHKVKPKDVVVNVVEERDSDAVSAENVSVEVRVSHLGASDVRPGIAFCCR